MNDELMMALPETEAGKRAHLRGLLTAKEATLASTGGLVRWGRPLMALVLVTSVFHLFAVLGGVALPLWVHILAAVLQVAGIDLLAWFATSARSAARTAGLKLHWAGQAVALGLVGSVNAAYLLQHTAGLPAGLAAWALPIASTVYAGLLMVFVPVAYLAIEGALHTLGEARLRLVRDIEVLKEVLAQTVAVTPPEPEVPVVVVQPEQPVALPEPVQPPLALPAPEDAPLLVTLLELEAGEAEKLDAALVVYRETGSKVKAVETAWGVKKSGSNKTYRRAMELLTSRLS